MLATKKSNNKSFGQAFPKACRGWDRVPQKNNAIGTRLNSRVPFCFYPAGEVLMFKTVCDIINSEKTYNKSLVNANVNACSAIAYECV